AVVATAASIGAVASTAAQTTRASASPTVIKMGIEPWIGYGPWWIVISKGYDRKHSVQIKSSTFTTDADINTAFAAHRIDAENLATHTGVRFLGSGVKLKFVLFGRVPDGRRDPRRAQYPLGQGPEGREGRLRGRDNE